MELYYKNAIPAQWGQSFLTGRPGARHLTPLRTARISRLKSDHFWLKYDGEKWSRKKYFEIPRAPSEIAAI